MPDAIEEVLTDDHVLDYPYVRSVGPVVGAFLTALRDGRIVGVEASGGRVVVPPTEYDPETAEPTGEIVEVGPVGVVETWSWVTDPLPQHPLDHPFAWVLVKMDGADTGFLHVLDTGDPAAVRTGMRVTPEFRPVDERVGSVADIRAFVPVAGAS